MEFALDNNYNRVHASDANKEGEYICPVCNKKVILRKGQINVDHFAHLSKCEDKWNYDMSKWHALWQKQFPKKNREVVLELEGEKHRADVMACGYVIEFQHSPISAEEFGERNNFYLKYGKKVVWIFDFCDEFKSGLIQCYKEWSRNNDNGGVYKWSHPKRFLKSFLPQENKDIILFFQYTNSSHLEKNEFYMERVTWAKKDGGYSDFSRFSTSYYPANSVELIEWIKKNKL